MANYFTSDHFKLLNKWKGQKRDDSNPEQNRAYEELKQAYEATEQWAHGLQGKLFPDGYVKVFKKPTNQANNFLAYNWARIYPTEASPNEMAYTVGINADNQFVVKIDTVGLDPNESLRKKYEQTRGSFDNSSPIVRLLPADEGLAMDMGRLVEWSAQRIGEFGLTYDQVCDQLEIEEQDPSFVHQEPMVFSNGAHGVSINPPPPKGKGHCMDVWVVCESIRSQSGKVPAREIVQNDPRLGKSNPGNVQQEFYRWRKWWNEGGDSAPALSDEEILKHFDLKVAFKAFRASWSESDRALFCRLARAVNAAGLDWWHTNIGNEVRFGRKNLGSERATAVLGAIHGNINARIVSIRGNTGVIDTFTRKQLKQQLVTNLETALSTQKGAIDAWVPLDSMRPGLWPDQLRDDPGGSTDDVVDSAISEQTRQPMNCIYYGPPGTGKTYKLARLLARDYEQRAGQVSPEQWREKILSEEVSRLTWWEAAAAALHDLGGKAKVGQLQEHRFIKTLTAAKGRSKNVTQTLWGVLQHHTVEESTTVHMKQRMAPAVFDKTTDSEWIFAGDGLEATADLNSLVERYKAGPPQTESVKRYSFVTFHQSYGYEEFVEGLRPVLDDDADSGNVRYEIRAGAFKELCQRARQAPGERFAMVIDEINRGNISKIFGELITLIEADKREGAENSISVLLPYSGESFSVPPNVDIIGTMNTADRSLALLDTALRRRFDFVPVLPDVRDEPDAPLMGLNVNVDGKEISIPKLLAAINQRIEALYDRDHAIGHAYFTELRGANDGGERMAKLADIFRNRVVPLLEEYFFEDWQKIRLVLADNQKPEAAQFVVEEDEHEEDLSRLFGSNHGLDAYGTRRRYSVQAAAFRNPDAYVGIFATLKS
jgi:5-methylcytosine-specific restriction protein B